MHTPTEPSFPFGDAPLEKISCVACDFEFPLTEASICPHCGFPVDDLQAQQIFLNNLQSAEEELQKKPFLFLFCRVFGGILAIFLMVSSLGIDIGSGITFETAIVFIIGALLLTLIGLSMIRPRLIFSLLSLGSLLMGIALGSAHLISNLFQAISVLLLILVSVLFYFAFNVSNQRHTLEKQVLKVFSGKRELMKRKKLRQMVYGE